MKTTLLKIAAAAAGITLALCVAVAAFFWYASRPKPPKPWNTNALRVATVKANPISTLNDKFQETGSGIFFTVDIENATPNDLTLQNLTIMQEAKSSHALHGSFLKLNRDYFLPAHHVATISLDADDLCAANFDPQKCFNNYFKEDDDQIVLFDNENRYEVRIPIPALPVKEDSRLVKPSK